MAPTTYCPARWLTVRSGGLPGRDTNCRISRPAVGARLSRSEPPRPSTALFAEVARAPASRRSASALAHATPRSPRGRLRDIAADKFFPIIGIRAMVNRGRVRRRASGRSSRPRRRKNWRKRDSGSTDRQPLDFPRNGQGKNLQILGKVWNFLGISLEKFGNPWKSLEKLGVTATRPQAPFRHTASNDCKGQTRPSNGPGLEHDVFWSNHLSRHCEQSEAIQT